MLLTLAFRHLRVKKLRSLFLLLGYGLGVGVMVVLLSVGRAMVEQAQDVALVGGGEVTVLPQGIDVEAMRTGGVSGMFFGIDRARFLTRVLVGGPRQRDIVAAVSPVIERKLVYLAFRGDTVAVRAGGELPDRAGDVGAGFRVIDGAWSDVPDDSAYAAPAPGRLYDELDRFHLPRSADTAWAEWQYFNLVTGPREWWYITYLIGGDIRGGRYGGRLLVTHRRPDGGVDRYADSVPASGVGFDTARADLSVGRNTVRQRDGLYALSGSARGRSGRVEFNLTMTPEPNRYFPPVELRAGTTPSGYVVPALAGRASGRLCVAGSCRRVGDALAYHDHNWGVWRDVTWDWGHGHGRRLDLLYGAVYVPEDSISGNRPSLFVTVIDSAGVARILRARSIRYLGVNGRVLGQGQAPAKFAFVAARDGDTLRVDAKISDRTSTKGTAAGPGMVFLQMRGRFRIVGRLSGEAVDDAGDGFFETYVAAGGRPAAVGPTGGLP
jgi:hypothetical protein